VTSMPKLFELDGLLPDSTQREVYDRSVTLFKAALTKESKTNAHPKLIALTPELVHLESDIIKLSNVFGREKAYNQKIAVLKDLIEQQHRNSDWNWKLQKETLLELAKTYEHVGKVENAYETFQFITNHFREKNSFVSEYAMMHRNRLKFAGLTIKQRNAENIEVLNILNDLKELQIYKNLASEPLHIEAALEYAWIRIHMNVDDPATTYLFFLTRLEEDYVYSEDPMTTLYQKNLTADSEKKVLYDAYMQFVEAEKLRCSATLAKVNNNLDEAKKLNAEANSLLVHLKETSSSYYLQQRVARSLENQKRAKIV